MAAQVAADVAAGAGVERGERLVEQEQAGLGGQRPGQRDPLGLTARQRARGGGRRGRPRPTRSSQAAAVARASALRRRRGPAARRRRSRARSGWGTAGSPGTRRRPAAAPAATKTSVAGSSRTSPSSSMRPASIGSEPGEAAEQRGLAGAVRAEQGDDLPGLGGELDVEVEASRASGRRGRRGSCRRGAPPPRNRSRSATSTAKETAISTRLRMIASSGFDLVGEVDGERHRLGAAGEVAGEGDRGAELAQRAGPGQHGAGDQRRADGGQRDPAEHVPARRAERAGRVLVAACRAGGRRPRR